MAEVKTAQDNSQAQLLVNRENGFKSRAINCQVLINQGMTFDDLLPPCKEPEILVYYDPKKAPTIPSSKTAVENAVRLCLLEAEHGIVDLTCPGAVPSP